MSYKNRLSFIPAFLPAIALIAIPVFASSANAMVAPTKGPAVYSQVFVPQGFDSNDQIQIVGAGVFENGCYRPAEASAKVDETAKRITITAAAYKYAGLCTQMILPFDRVINVGIVPAGDYKIVQSGQSKVLGKLHVDEARTSDADDFSYAPIKQAFIDNQVGNKADLIVKGVFPTNCAKIQEVRVKTDDHVIVAQPIMTVENLSDCAVGYFPFRQVVPVTVPNGEYLLHVRSMNANSINNLVDMQ